MMPEHIYPEQPGSDFSVVFSFAALTEQMAAFYVCLYSLSLSLSLSLILSLMVISLFRDRNETTATREVNEETVWVSREVIKS